MKLVTYVFNGMVGFGAVVEGKWVVSLTSIANDMLSFIQDGSGTLEQAEKHLKSENNSIPLQKVHLLAPIPVPIRNIMCLGKNYTEHAIESHRAWGDKAEIPQFPVIFTKSPFAANGPYDDIPYDPNVSTAIDFEAELLLVIGRSGINITREKAMDHIYGYSVINDITARDLQRRHVQFFKGKSLDGYAPMGPWIVTASEINGSA